MRRFRRRLRRRSFRRRRGKRIKRYKVARGGVML